jgi:hypothetical protein
MAFGLGSDIALAGDRLVDGDRSSVWMLIVAASRGGRHDDEP